MGLNEFPPQPREGLMTKQPPCAPWPAASFNQGIWHLPKLLGYEEQRGEERKWRRDCRRRSGEMLKRVVGTIGREKRVHRNRSSSKCYS